MQQVVVGSLMNPSVSTTAPTIELGEVVHTMRNQQTSAVVVVEQDKPIGIVTERDLVRVLSEVLDGERSETTVVREFMSSPAITMEKSTPLFDALVVTQSRSIRHVPVIEADGQLCGMLSYTDLAHAYEHIIEQQREIIEREIGNETKRLQEVNEQLKALSLEDPLLGIGNRRSMEVDLEYTHNVAVRYPHSYAVILFDVDCFKQYNDYYGHQAGDEALKFIVEHIRANIRASDRLYRYGGEELLLVLPATNLVGAQTLGARITASLMQRRIPHVKSEHRVLTISGGIGIPDFDPARGGIGADSWQAVIERADKALYMAKHNGRNRVQYV